MVEPDGVVGGRYHSHGDEDAPQTTVELFGRCEDGASICVSFLLRPTLKLRRLESAAKTTRYGE